MVLCLPSKFLWRVTTSWISPLILALLCWLRPGSNTYLNNFIIPFWHVFLNTVSAAWIIFFGRYVLKCTEIHHWHFNIITCIAFCFKDVIENTGITATYLYRLATMMSKSYLNCLFLDFLSKLGFTSPSLYETTKFCVLPLYWRWWRLTTVLNDLGVVLV